MHRSMLSGQCTTVAVPVFVSLADDLGTAVAAAVDVVDFAAAAAAAAVVVAVAVVAS